MKIIGERIFAKDSNGALCSRIGTIFLKGNTLITEKGVHAMQRLLWIKHLNDERKAAGKPELTLEEEEAEIAESVDLIFTEEFVLIRPDPDRMDLALRADEELQKIVSKRLIRFLNTNALKVRRALMERGENWRMARQPISQEDMAQQIRSSITAIDELPIYYYNRSCGTRYITASGYSYVELLDNEAFRRQIKEVVQGLNKRNRLGQNEIDLFPLTTPPEIKKALKTLNADDYDDESLRALCMKIDLDWRMSMPVDLRDETIDNFEWRNAMCHAITRRPNETAAEEQELISGISPEFYRQIEWLPGLRILNGRVVFDSIYDEAVHSPSPEVKAICDLRVKSFLFNTTRLFGSLDFINIGRISRSLARKPIEGNRRGNVYIMQYREHGAAEIKVMMIRLQKWGVSERLDEGKDLLRAIVESDEYSDYVLDRRLMCRQLGMNLPKRLGFGHFTEQYHGDNKYNSMSLRTAYFVRGYVHGLASDKVPVAKLHNPLWATKFAALMGGAAATDMIVGRRNSLTKEVVFDTDYEIVQIGEDSLPHEIRITDHAGSFVDYEGAFEDVIASYARFALSRRDVVSDYPSFVKAYVDAFKAKLVETKAAYQNRRAAFDELFADRPYDTNGSGAYRWKCALKRLELCDPEMLAAKLKAASQC